MTIAMLSWGARQTLMNTLESYKKYELDLLDPERIIFFQEITDEDRQIAEAYSWVAEGSPINVGIANGYKSLVAHATGDLFLFLENDWELIEPPKQIIYDAAELLRQHVVDVVRLRHVKNPGNPLWSRIYEGREMDGQSHLLDSVHWKEQPDVSFPGLINKVDDWYFTTAQFANWTNNPTMFRTDYLRTTLLPHFGTIDVEIDMQEWWNKQDFTFVAQHEQGLFTHNRLDR